jgi:flagellar protein FliS
MFGSPASGAKAYAKVQVETGVAAANSHRLIVMLFDGALIAVRTALKEMQASNIAAKGEAVSKAISIIDGGLRASLDKKVGGDIAENLDALYAYMSKQLLMANLQNDPVKLEEVLKLLVDLRDAWCAIGDTNEERAPQQQLAAVKSAYDPLAPNVVTLVKA